MGKFFTIEELCKSSVADKFRIDNRPNKKIVENLNALIENVLDPLRKKLGKPIIVTSGYRCEELNKKVGGVPTSHHVLGYAADIVTKNKVDQVRMFAIMRESGIPCTQLSWEKGSDKCPDWIHVSYVPNNLKKQVLRIR